MGKVQLPILKTQRLTLRNIQPADATDMFEYSCLCHVGPNAGWVPHRSIEDSINVINQMIEDSTGDIGQFSIISNDNQKMIGTIGLNKYNEPKGLITVGYVLNPDYWGKGIMLEACSEVIKYCFNDLNIFRIECSHYDFNHQSKRVIEKLGFKFEGIARLKAVLVNGQRCDLYNYSILKTEYENNELPWQK